MKRCITKIQYHSFIHAFMPCDIGHLLDPGRGFDLTTYIRSFFPTVACSTVKRSPEHQPSHDHNKKEPRMDKLSNDQNWPKYSNDLPPQPRPTRRWVPQPDLEVKATRECHIRQIACGVISKDPGMRQNYRIVLGTIKPFRWVMTTTESIG